MVGVLVALAAGIGAVARYLLDTAVQRRVPPGFPWGTMVVNVSGSFAFGVVTASVAGSAASVLGAGFCGGFTTLSTLTWETLALAEEGSRSMALFNLLGSVALGLLAAAAGLAVRL